MTKITELMELQPADRRRSREAENHQGRDTSPDNDALMEDIFDYPQKRVLKKIASLPDIRRGKVLNTRRQITKGTYDVTDRLNRAIDRVLEAITG